MGGGFSRILLAGESVRRKKNVHIGPKTPKVKKF